MGRPGSQAPAGLQALRPERERAPDVRDLLCHRSGIGGHDLLWYRAPWGIDEVVKRVQLLPLDYPFRGGYRYSSIPFLVAGRAIEKRTGEKWEKLVRTRICEPLGMTGVTFTTTEIPNGRGPRGGASTQQGGQAGGNGGLSDRGTEPVRFRERHGARPRRVAQVPPRKRRRPGRQAPRFGQELDRDAYAAEPDPDERFGEGAEPRDGAACLRAWAGSSTTTAARR